MNKELEATVTNVVLGTLITCQDLGNLTMFYLKARLLALPAGLPFLYYFQPEKIHLNYPSIISWLIFHLNALLLHPVP